MRLADLELAIPFAEEVDFPYAEEAEFPYAMMVGEVVGTQMVADCQPSTVSGTVAFGTVVFGTVVTTYPHYPTMVTRAC